MVRANKTDIDNWTKGFRYSVRSGPKDAALAYSTTRREAAKLAQDKGLKVYYTTIGRDGIMGVATVEIGQPLCPVFGSRKTAEKAGTIPPSSKAAAKKEANKAAASAEKDAKAAKAAADKAAAASKRAEQMAAKQTATAADRAAARNAKKAATTAKSAATSAKSAAKKVEKATKPAAQQAAVVAAVKAEAQAEAKAEVAKDEAKVAVAAAAPSSSASSGDRLSAAQMQQMMEMAKSAFASL